MLPTCAKLLPTRCELELAKSGNKWQRDRMKVSVSKVMVRGERRFMVSWRPPGQARRRRFFAAKSAADAQANDLRGQLERAGVVWLALTAADRNSLLAAAEDAKRGGFTVQQAVNFFREHQGSPTIQLTLADAFGQFTAEKEAQRLSFKTLAALRSTVGRFIAGREAQKLAAVQRADVLEWLQNPEWGPRTFNSYLTSLKTFFKWAVAAEHLPKSPAENISKIKERQMPDLDVAPHILTNEQVTRLLAVTLETDKGLVPYVATCVFAGLRPEREAGRLAWSDIGQKEITVRGLHAKDRQRRQVEIHPTLKEWLAIGGDLPPVNLRRRFEAVREKAALIKREKVEGTRRLQITPTGWGQDCLRHTFASNLLPIVGAEKTIAQMGHGDYAMLFKHYRQIVSDETAKAFWNLTPAAVQSKGAK